MKENSLARAEIRWAEGEGKTILSLIVLCLTAERDFRERHFLSTHRSAQPLAWRDHINSQPVPVFLSSSCLDAFIDEVTGKANSWKLNQTLSLTRNMKHWHLRLGILACLLDVPDTFRLSLCHLCPLERKCHTDASDHFGSNNDTEL